jgi:hypothetical protein
MGQQDSSGGVRSTTGPARRGAVVIRLHERRQAPRERLIQGATLIGPGAGLRCVLLDLSEGGARLWLPDPGLVPALMVIRIAGAPDRAARRRWQHGQEMGLQFLPG